MALTSKKYERIFSKTGSDADLVSTSDFDEMKEDFDNNNYLNDVGQLKVLGPVLYQIQQMQDEIDYLRTEISSNKDKATFPGLGTSSTTALAGDTALLALGTSGSTALAGDTKIISIGSNTTLSFGDLTETIIKGKATYTILLSATRDFGGKTGVLTKSSIITLI